MFFPQSAFGFDPTIYIVAVDRVSHWSMLNASASVCSLVINQNGRNKLRLLSITSSRDVIPAPAQHFLPPDERERKRKRILPWLHSCKVVCNIVAICDDIATIKKSSQFAVTVSVCRCSAFCAVSSLDRGVIALKVCVYIPFTSLKQSAPNVCAHQAAAPETGTIGINFPGILIKICWEIQNMQ